MLIAGVLTLNSVTAQNGIIISDFESSDRDDINLNDGNSGNLTGIKNENTFVNAVNSSLTVVRITEAANSASWNRVFVNNLTQNHANLNAENGYFFTMLIRSQKSFGTVSMFFNNDFSNPNTVSYSQAQPNNAGDLGDWIPIEFDF